MLRKCFWHFSTCEVKNFITNKYSYIIRIYSIFMFELTLISSPHNLPLPLLLTKDLGTGLISLAPESHSQLSNFPKRVQTIKV